MRVDIVAPAIGGGDLGDRAIDLPHLRRRAATIRTIAPSASGSTASPLPMLDIMAAAVDPVDDQIMAIVKLVRRARAARPGRRPASHRARLMDDPVGQRAGPAGAR